jgi:hypothetical protein
MVTIPINIYKKMKSKATKKPKKTMKMKGQLCNIGTRIGYASKQTKKVYKSKWTSVNTQSEHERQVVHARQQEEEKSIICQRQIETLGVLPQPGIASETRQGTIKYGSSQAMLIAQFIQDITLNISEHGASFAQQYVLQKGLKVFGKKGHDASMKEINQLHRTTCFAPLKVKNMKPSKRRKVHMAFMFLIEKKGKACER